MKWYFVLFCTLLSSLVISQVRDNFDDGDLTSDPIWLGDVTNFTTNAEGYLKLQAPVSTSRSFIYTKVNIPDSFSLKMNLLIEFSPSATNLARIYINIDNIDVTKANGYYLNFGENGSADAIKLYRLANGMSTLLASGTSGAIANATNNVSFELTYKDNGKWTLKSAYDNALAMSTEFVIDEIWKGSRNGNFAIECIYTSTRVDKFGFDNLVLEQLKPDLTPPSIISALILPNNELEISCSEEIQLPTSANFKLTPNINIKSVRLDASNKNKLILTLDEAVKEGQLYKLELLELKDLVGNSAKNIIVSDIGVLAIPLVGDLLLTEILFDPVVNGEDFIELYNTSSKALNLQGLKIINTLKLETITISTKISLGAKEYICISKNPTQVRAQYSPPSTAIIVAGTLPSLNNDAGNVTIRNERGTSLDSFTYTDKLHNSLLSSVDGVSLQRQSKSDGTWSNIWSSGVKSSSFATPGYVNSGQIGESENIDDIVSVTDRVFSPDNDGFRDELILNYKLPKSGFFSTIKIYSAEGHLVKELLNNELVSTDGIVKWNGINQSGQRERVGIYYINGSFYHEDGDASTFSKSCILALKL